MTGKYTFWVSADDAGEFSLSSDASPEKAQRIAVNRIGNKAHSEEWDRFPSQRSREITLEAGKNYYVEALHVQSFGRDNFAVAWAGPGIDRAIIDGRYLTPWNTTQPTNGLLWESWTNFLTPDYEMLSPKNQNESVVRILSMKLIRIGDSGMPVPLERESETSLDEIPNLHWTAVEGEVTFAATDGNRCRLELKREKGVLNVSVLNGSGFAVERLLHSRVRVEGVLVHTYRTRDNAIDSMMWAPGGQQISLLTSDGNQPENESRVAISELEPTNPAMNWGRRVNVTGRIISRTTNGFWVLEGADNYQGFCSVNGTNWVSLGKPVEIEMDHSASAGLVVISHSAGRIATAKFEGLQGWKTNWSGTNMGNSDISGNFDFNNGVLTVHGGKRPAGAGSDQVYYVFQPLQDEAEIIVQLTDLTQNSSDTQVGLMIRQSLRREVPYAAVLFSYASGVMFQYQRTAQEGPAGFETRQKQQFRWMRLVRQKSVLLVQAKPDVGIRTNQQVEVSGIITWHNDQPILAEAFIRSVAKNVATSPPPVNVSQKRALISDFVTKALHPPEPYLSDNLQVVNLDGVVTFCGEVSGRYYLFIQQAGEGIRVRWPDGRAKPALETGQSVEIDGRAAVRRFPVVLEPASLKIKGWETLSEPAMYSASRVADGSDQARWVEVTGVVRSEKSNGMMNLMTSEGVLPVWIGRRSRTNGTYVDTVLRLRGVLSLERTNRAQLLVPSLEFAEVLENSPADPFSIPTFSIVELSRLNVKPERLRKMKLRGTVTSYAQFGLFVQDETAGLFIENRQAASFHPGDQVEAVGFPDRSLNTISFREPDIRKVGIGALPEPIRISGNFTNADNYANKLVSAEGVLLETRNLPGIEVFTLQAGTKLFEVVRIVSETNYQSRIPSGSRLAITGICQVAQETMHQSGLQEIDALAKASSFKIWVSNPSAIVLLNRPSWWTWKKVAVVVIALSSALIGTLIRIRLLRRRVAEQKSKLKIAMQHLERETRNAAVLAERDRLAGEIHDSVSQGLDAIILQLDTAVSQEDNPTETRRLLDMARSMAEFSRSEVEHAMWDLQSPVLANADLGTALKYIIGQINPQNTPRVTVAIEGGVRPLPSAIEHHLLRIGQEAITNAMKHAEAGTIEVELNYSDSDFCLSIRDNGVGFVPDAVKSGHQLKHLGLRGIRARARKIKGRIEVFSKINQGTTIVVQLTNCFSQPEVDSHKPESK